MRSWKSGFVNANGLKIHYTRTGGEKRPLVLSHGITDDGLCWTPVADRLAANYDIIMVDARGHGRSEAPPDGYDSFSQAEDLAGVIAALELSKPILLGHSMGAATSLAMTGRHPELPGGLILEDPPAWWMPPDEPTDQSIATRQNWLDGMAAHKRKTHQELVTEQRLAAAAWSEAELKPWAEAKQRFSLNILKIADEIDDASADWQAIIPKITCPVLLITADPVKGAIVNPESAANLQKLCSGKLEIAHIPGAGHNIRREQFEAYMESVGTFLTRL